MKWGTKAGVAAALLLVAACGDDSSREAAAGGPTTEITEAASEAGADTTTPETTPPAPPTTRPPAPPPPVTQLEAVKIKATPVVDTPMLTAIAWREGDPNPYITDQHGTIYHVVGGRSEPVLDLTPQVLDYEPGAEYGLLGIAFDPMDGRMIVGYNDLDVDTNIVSFALAADGRPDPASVREILRVDQPGMGHKGGHLAFDAAGNLLISMGDGGGSSGADAQDMTKLLGGLLRITPNRNGPGYTVPADNPYVGQPGIAPEIWAKGMRNPWRFSVDHATGDIWVGNVGESSWEAVYKIPAGTKGANLGWPTYEGSHRIDFNSQVAAPPNPMMPVYEYSHDVGPAVIGGYVYRGTAIPQLAGAYLFMDMSGPVWALGADGVVALDVQAGGLQTSFGEGPDGELYLLTQQNGLFKIEPS